jgi:hypothetical protein
MAFDLIHLFSFEFSPFGKGQSSIDLLKDVVCYNQGELAQYSYLAGEKHKAMKDEFNAKNGSASKKLKKCKVELENHLNTEFMKIAKSNFERIKKYFHGRAKMEPRVCIKAYREKKIIDLIREKDQLYRVDCGLEENKGFYEVHETGKYYFCNNIPLEVKRGRYFNPRLQIHKAEQFKPKTLDWLWKRLGKEDERWIECWDKISIRGKAPITPLAEQCYKSTMITPMTLLGNVDSLWSTEFRERFGINIGERSQGRVIYGFLCFDHHYKGYFIEKVDIPVSYIFADLLSLYLIINLIYTEYSTTYKKVEQCFVKKKK